jgi:peptidoglycan LD-endopeptidase CwlK
MDRQSLQNLNTLDPKFRPIALQAWDEAQRAMPAGVTLVVIQGFRSPAESNRLAAETRTGPRAVPGGKSYHNYGLAFDFEMYSNGRQVPRVDANWLKVVSIMKSYGMAWGGDFKSNYDPGHFEMSFGYTWRQLLAGIMPDDISPPAKPNVVLIVIAVVVGLMFLNWIVE